jgi:GntR family transcriptional regulator
MAQYGTSLMTIRRALDELVLEGLLETKDKIGVYVRSNHRYRLDITKNDPVGFNPPAPSLAALYLQELAKGGQVLSQTMEVRRVMPSSYIADRLGVGRQLVLLRHMVCHAGSEKISISDGYHRLDIAAGSDLERAEPLPSVFDVLDNLGHAPTKLVNEVLMRSATAQESAEMGWARGLHVLVQTSTSYTEAGRPVYCWESVLPGDRWILTGTQVRDLEQRPVVQLPVAACQ